MKHFVAVFFVFLILLLVQISNAQTAFTGLSSQAMGGTGRAGVEATEVGFLNPASIGHVRGYNIATGYRDFSVGDSGSGSSKNIMIHASESQTDSLFPLAVTYLKTKNSNLTVSGEIEAVHLTTAQIYGKKFSFGIDVARYTYEPAGAQKDNEWDGKIGLLYTPKKNLGLGFVFSNILGTDFYFLKKNIELGVNYIFDDFLRLAFDVYYPVEDNDDNEGNLMLGVEHMYLKQFPVRLGFRWEDLINENYWTLGFGWNGPKIGFNYAYEKNVSNTKEYAHSFDLKIYF